MLNTFAYEKQRFWPQQGPNLPPQQALNLPPQQALNLVPPQGITVGMQQGLPAQGSNIPLQQGLNVGMQQGLPQQGLNLLSQSNPNLVPQQGLYIGMQQGVPQQGLPQGLQQGLYVGPQQGVYVGPQQGLYVGPPQSSYLTAPVASSIQPITTTFRNVVPTEDESGNFVLRDLKKPVDQFPILNAPLPMSLERLELYKPYLDLLLTSISFLSLASSNEKGVFPEFSIETDSMGVVESLLLTRVCNFQSRCPSASGSSGSSGATNFEDLTAQSFRLFFPEIYKQKCMSPVLKHALQFSNPISDFGPILSAQYWKNLSPSSQNYTKETTESEKKDYRDFCTTFYQKLYKTYMNSFLPQNNFTQQSLSNLSRPLVLIPNTDKWPLLLLERKIKALCGQFLWRKKFISTKDLYKKASETYKKVIDTELLEILAFGSSL
jgi:hypothetical protein